MSAFIFIITYIHNIISNINIDFYFTLIIKKK